MRCYIQDMKKTRIFLLSLCVAILFVGCATAPRAHPVEYKTVVTYNRAADSELNDLGKEGWVVVGFSFTPRSQTSSNDEYRYVLKRPAK